MDNTTFQKLKDLITRYQNVGIIVTSNPNLDQMAAGLGLFLVLKQLGKNVSVVCSTDVTVSLSSLVGINNVSKAFNEVGGDLTVSFPYKEGEIDKVSYNLENGQLNIVVKAGEKGLSFNHKDVSFIRNGSAPELLVCIGISSLSSISNVYFPNGQIQSEIINIDNKAENEKYGAMVIVDSKWSSISEQVADFVTLLEPQIELDADTSQNLLNGIISATNDFSTNTSYLAFEVAGILMKKGATREKARSVVNLSKGSNTNVSVASNQFFPNPNKQANINVSSQQPKQTRQQIISQTKSINNNQAPVLQPISNINNPVSSRNVKQDTSLPEAPPDWLTPKVYKGSSVI